MSFFYSGKGNQKDKVSLLLSTYLDPEEIFVDTRLLTPEYTRSLDESEIISKPIDKTVTIEKIFRFGRETETVKSIFDKYIVEDKKKQKKRKYDSDDDSDNDSDDDSDNDSDDDN